MASYLRLALEMVFSHSSAPFAAPLLRQRSRPLPLSARMSTIPSSAHSASSVFGSLSNAPTMYATSMSLNSTWFLLSSLTMMLTIQRGSFSGSGSGAAFCCACGDSPLVPSSWASATSVFSPGVPSLLRFPSGVAPVAEAMRLFSAVGRVVSHTRQNTGMYSLCSSHMALRRSPLTILS